MEENKLLAQLFSFKDEKYKEFISKLIPTINPDCVIGIRTPVLRKFAAEFAETPDSAEFLKLLPHKYYEENNLHAFIIERMKDYDEIILALDDFLPYIDNWATCDSLSPRIFKKNPPQLINKIKEWLNSNHEYTVRFGIKMLMTYYLDDSFTLEYPKLVAAVNTKAYYVHMMVAWYFATALAKHYNEILPFIENHVLDRKTHNKAIQKAVESYRISAEQKAYLKSQKV